MLVDRGVGFDGIDLEGEDGAVEEGEFGVGLEDPGAVNGVGVGEEDEAVSGGMEGAHGFPHGFVGGEDVPPCVVEAVVGGVGSQGVERPGGVVGDGDAASLELVLFGE